MREHTAEQILARNVMLPEVDTAREFWLQATDARASCGTRGSQRETTSSQGGGVLPVPWRQAGMLENARRKAQNEITKMIGKQMGNFLEDLTKASLDKIEKYVKPEAEEPEGALVPAAGPVWTLEEARQRGDWLFI